MRILVDMDGVLADFEGGFLKRWREKYPNKPYIPLEDRRTFYAKDQYPFELHRFMETIRREPGFFLNMEPIPGAIAALQSMDEFGWDVFLCSSPLSAYEHCVLEKYKWIEKYFGRSWIKRLILTKDKTIINANFLIDDKPVITGVQPQPDWEQIVYDQPYNREVSGKRRLTWNTWKTVLLPEMEHFYA